MHEEHERQGEDEAEYLRMHEEHEHRHVLGCDFLLTPPPSRFVLPLPLVDPIDSEVLPGRGTSSLEKSRPVQAVTVFDPTFANVGVLGSNRGTLCRLSVRLG